MLLFILISLSSISYAIPHKSWSTEPRTDISIPIRYHRSIDRWIRQFTTENKPQVRRWLERSALLLPYMKRELRGFGLPEDLAYLVLIESGVSPYATSRAQAVGPWQFVKETGKRYGLRASWWLDERRDFEKSTRAAILYLKDLHRQFGDWYLAMAAYNMGENGLRRRIKRYRTRDYWRLADLGAIPKETRNYVPKFLATLFIAKSPGKYGFSTLHTAPPVSWEKVTVKGGTELSEIADRLDISRRYLRWMNAELIRGHVPKSIKRHKIRVPKGGAGVIARSGLLNNRGSFSLRSRDQRISKK